MPLAIGSRIGIYDVGAALGEGGMGQVFRARDTRLGRDVAIKILPEAFAHDADRLARFQREAKTLASLNHPNIAAVYGLEETGGVTALVMELVDGEDLGQRLARGKLPLDEALPIANQIADALEAAHEQGIVHRDLKPANVKVRADGTVKVLDFGLAKAIAPADGSVGVGGPVPVIEGVRRATTENPSAVTQFDVSHTGTLAYIPGPTAAPASRLSIGLFDRKGGFEAFKIQPGPYSTPRVSPDGRRIAFGTDDGKAAAIWVYEVSGASAMRRLTFDGQGRNRYPIWSDDSQRVAFQSDREGDLGIFWQRADGDGAAERLTRAEAGRAHIPETWSPHGTNVLFSELSGLIASVQVLSLKDRTVSRFNAESSFAAVPGTVFSPDGRWVAYASRQGRTRSAVYVQPFPPTGAKYQLSSDADDGHHPLWSPDGSELLFNPGPGPSLFVMRIGRQASFSYAEGPPIVSPVRKAAPGYPRPYDMTRDGRLLGLIDASEAQASASVPQIQIVLGWFEELRAKSGAN